MKTWETDFKAGCRREGRISGVGNLEGERKKSGP